MVTRDPKKGGSFGKNFEYSLFLLTIVTNFIKSKCGSYFKTIRVDIAFEKKKTGFYGN